MAYLTLQSPYLCRYYYGHDKFDSVSLLQERLNEVEPTSMLSVDGYFGVKTQETVKRFQSRNGILVDGIVGPQTIGCLNAFVGKPMLRQEGSLLNAKKTSPSNKYDYSGEYIDEEITGPIAKIGYPAIKYDYSGEYIDEEITVPITKVSVYSERVILLDKVADTMGTVGTAIEVVQTFYEDWKEITIIPKELLRTIATFSKNALPSIYYKNWLKVSFKYKPFWRKLRYFNKEKTGVVQQVGKYANHASAVWDVYTIKNQWNDLKVKERDGTVTIKDYIDLSMTIVGIFASMLQAAVDGIEYFEKKGVLDKLCFESLKNSLKAGGKVVGKLKVLTRWLGVIGLCVTAIEVGVWIGNQLKKIPIGDQNLGYFVEVEIDEMFNHPYEWAFRRGCLGHVLTIALMVDGWKRGVNTLTLAQMKMNEMTSYARDYIADFNK